MQKNNPYVRGFTLVELLIYIVIFASAAFLLTGTLTTVVRVQSREALSTDLSNQLTFILDTTTRLVRESSVIEKVYEGTNEAAPCATYCSVKLRMPISANDPTIIRSDANGIYLKQGAGTESILTNDKVEVANLILKQDTVQNAKSILNIDVALRTKTTNPVLQVTRSLKSAIGRVSAATFDSGLFPNTNLCCDIGASGLLWNNAYIGNRIGLGTASPAPILGTFGRLMEIEDSSNPAILLHNTGASGKQWAIYSGGAGDLWFYDSTVGTSRVSISSAGRLIAQQHVEIQGSLGLGISAPRAKVDIADGDVYIANSSNGIIMKSPDGTCARGTLTNSETLAFTSVACP